MLLTRSFSNLGEMQAEIYQFDAAASPKGKTATVHLLFSKHTHWTKTPF